MNQITVSKELLLNLGNYSNIKIIASITTDEKDFATAWSELNNEIVSQQHFETQLRMPNKAPQVTNSKEEAPF
jgi:hypothetical protein